VYRFLDIKTYGAKEELTHAKGDDIAQVASYMYFHQYDESETKLPIKIDQEIGYVVYFLKTMNMKAPQMVFRVKPTDRLLDPIRQKAADFSNSVNTGVLPPTLQSCVSVHWSSGKAKGCSRKTECQRYYDLGIDRIGIQ